MLLTVFKQIQLVLNFRRTEAAYCHCAGADSRSGHTDIGRGDVSTGLRERVRHQGGNSEVLGGPNGDCDCTPAEHR